MTNGRRPRIGQTQLKNGFYIEVCTKGTKKGIKIRSESKNDMELNVNLYERFKDVIILGEYKNGVPFINVPPLIESIVLPRYYGKAKDAGTQV
jgi:hypothetical protein